MNDNYQAEVEAQLKEWSREIQSLKARADKALAEAKKNQIQAKAQMEYFKQLEALYLKHEAAEQSVQALKEAAGQLKTEALKMEIERTMRDLADTLTWVKSMEPQKIDLD